MFAWAAAPMAMLGASAFAWGPEGGALLVGQAVLSVLMLEAANYVQHYGLQRSKLDNGRCAVPLRCCCCREMSETLNASNQ